MHENWKSTNILETLEKQAARRSLKDLTIACTLALTNEEFKEHCEKVLAMPGAKLLFGGEKLTDHKIPACYGCYKPTAIYVPLKNFEDPHKFEILTTELFGPFQIVTDYLDSEVDVVLEICERMHHHLTAAVVSNDPLFLDRILGSTVNGTTYCGLRGRTTGSP